MNKKKLPHTFEKLAHQNFYFLHMYMYTRKCVVVNLCQCLHSLISSRFDILLLAPIEKLEFLIFIMLSMELIDFISCLWTSENLPKLSTILNASRNSLKSILPSWFRSMLLAMSDIWSRGQLIFCCFTRSWITSSNSSIEIWPTMIPSNTWDSFFF